MLVIRKYQGRKLIALCWPCVPPVTAEDGHFTVSFTVSSEDLERLHTR